MLPPCSCVCATINVGECLVLTETAYFHLLGQLVNQPGINSINSNISSAAKEVLRTSAPANNQIVISTTAATVNSNRSIKVLTHVLKYAEQFVVNGIVRSTTAVLPFAGKF